MKITTKTSGVIAGVLLIAVIMAGCKPKTASPQKASTDDSVLVVLNHVKDGKQIQFEDFYKNYLAPAGIAIQPETKATVRVLKPTQKNSDGYSTYIFIMDPYVTTYDYDIYNILVSKYGKDKAKQYLKMYTDCLKDGDSESYMSIQTNW